MADVHDKKTRSYNMSMIRSKGTKTEILVRKFFLIRMINHNGNAGESYCWESGF